MEEESIDISELLYTIWTKKIIIFICLFLGIIAGLSYTVFLITPMYESTTTLVLATSNTSDNENTSITANDLTVNSKLVSTYSEIVKSRTIAEEVIKDLNLDMSVDEFVNNVDIDSKTGTEILVISVSNVDGKVAAKIANKIAEVFSEKVKDIYNIENVSIIDKAIESTQPYNVTFAKNVAIFAFAGIVVAFCIIFIIMLFDNTVRNQDDVERMLGIPILAVIPKVESKE
jgi:capsular polysaccharide biosynthesis protein